MTEYGHVTRGENCTQAGFRGPRRGSMMSPTRKIKNQTHHENMSV